MCPVPTSPRTANGSGEPSSLGSRPLFQISEGLEQSLSGLDRENMLLRLKRELRARLEAEWLLENKAKELFEANESLKKVASSLEGQRLQLNTIFEHAQAGIILARYDLAISRANRVALKMFGLAEDYFLDHTVLDLIEGPRSAIDWIEEKLKKAENHGELSIEAIGRKEDGFTFPVDVSVSVIEHQGKSYSVWVFHDITRRKEEEERRSLLEQELSQAQKLEALGTLASGVAH